MVIRALLFGFLSALCCSVVEAEERPNILFAISDDQSYPHCSAYGAKELSTPAFDRVAKEGILFHNAYAASPGCSPCRAALLTGRHTWQIEHAGTHASSFPAKYVTFPKLLAEAGYHVGYTGKGWGPGNYKISGREQNPAGPSYSKMKTKLPHGGIRNTDYAANFSQFLEERDEDQPFCFWYGASEPHRGYEKGVGKKVGKNPDNVNVPEFLPDVEEIRNDLLDYYVEIEWFDKHLGLMLNELEQQRLLENTLVIVTSDNGMPFPRAKANCFEYGIHMPLAIRWGSVVKAGREVEDLVGFVDLTATILDAAGVEHPSEEYPLSGRSLRNILESTASGVVDPSRSAVYSARERHSSSRYNNLAYPQRAMRTEKHLYIRNFKPERWPAGAPQKLEKDGELGPMHGGYHDIDACPTLTYLIEHRDDPKVSRYFHWAVDHRPAVELYDIQADPACLRNLALETEFDELKAELGGRLEAYLLETGDPRMSDGDIFETYKRYSPLRSFPTPDWAKERDQS